MTISGNYQNRFNANLLGEIKLTPRDKESFEEQGVLFSDTKFNIPDKMKDMLKPIKEETINNPDGTTSTVKTYGDGYTVTTTAKKDKNGQEYIETIQKRADGSLHAEIIKYSGKSSETKFYDKEGNLETQLNQTYNEDGKTIKTETQINYHGKDLSGNPKIAFERHTYENGNKSEIFYSDNGTPERATVNTKEGKNAVELSFDLKDSQLEAGNVKLDEHGWPMTKDGKYPKIQKKVTNPGLPTETTTEYEYREDGTISEYTRYSNGQFELKYYDNIEDLRARKLSSKSLKELMNPSDAKPTQKPKPKEAAKPTDEAKPEDENKPAAEAKPADEAPSTQEEKQEYTEHKIQSGDTLSAIARKYGTTVAELVKLNNIKNPDLIIVGKTLKIPTKQTQTEVVEDKPANPPASTPATNNKKGGTGKVKKEDCRETALKNPMVYYNEATKTHYIEKDGKMVEFRPQGLRKNEKVVMVIADGRYVGEWRRGDNIRRSIYNKQGLELYRWYGKSKDKWDPRGDYTSWNYNSNGHMVSETYYDGKEKPVFTQYFDDLGRDIKKRDHKRGITFTWKYFSDGSYIIEEKNDNGKIQYTRQPKEGKAYPCDKDGNKI